MLQVQLSRIWRPRRAQGGNVIIMVLGVAAVVGMMTVEIYRRSELLTASSQRNALRAHADTIMTSFGARLQNADTCSVLLRGQRLQPGVAAGSPPPVNQLRMAYRLDPNMATTIQSPEQVIPGVWLWNLGATLGARDMTAHVTVKTPAGGIETLDLDRYPGTLDAVFVSGPRGAPAAGLATINRTGVLGLPVYFWLNRAGGLIHSCFRANSASAVCNEMGGYFDPLETDYSFACVQSISVARVNPATGALANIGTARSGATVGDDFACDSLMGAPWQAKNVQDHLVSVDGNFKIPDWAPAQIRRGGTPYVYILQQYSCIRP